MRAAGPGLAGTDEDAMTEQPNISELLEFTTEIVAAHAGNNTVAPDDLPRLIQDVYKTLSGLGGAPAVQDRPKPAVAVKKSVFPDYIVCLEDGKKLKMLKRHLKTAYDMTPEEYRERWGLPADYPMVAPNYAKHRSNLAKKIGLGTKPRARRK
jgi:predicted transcriptional regulator